MSSNIGKTPSRYSAIKAAINQALDVQNHMPALNTQASPFGQRPSLKTKFKKKGRPKKMKGTVVETREYMEDPTLSRYGNNNSNTI